MKASILKQTHLGIWPLSKFSVEEISHQLSGEVGVYGITNKITGRILVGEGVLGGAHGRIRKHFIRPNNTPFKKDLLNLGNENFELSWIILEKDERTRKLIEHILQQENRNNTYNVSRKIYPSQKDLIEDDGLSNKRKTGPIIKRINRYAIVQRVDGFDECWESTNGMSGPKNKQYACIKFRGQIYKHHVLSFILHQGDICGISSTINHKCKNKLCVNPNHLENITNIENIHYHYGTVTKIKKEYSNPYIGVCFHSNTYRYTASIKINSKTVNLGNYRYPIEAAKNRDYFIVRNNFLNVAKLNFFDIDYRGFKPYLTISGKINRNLLL